MDWRERFKEKIKTAEEAVRLIKSGDRVVMGHAAGEPSFIVDTMIANRELYTDVEIINLVPLGKMEYCKEGMEKYFRHNALFTGKPTKDAVHRGQADFTPCFFHKVPELLSTELRANVAIVSLSRPDEHGFCSFGTSVDYTKPAAEAADIIIAQINDRMPRTLGDSFINLADVDCIVEHTQEVIELKPPTIGDVERAIGEHCASLINDGDTLQLGIGAIPDAVLLFLKDKKDLGIHSEMISDGVVELVESGVINNKRKNFHKGKILVTLLMGTRRLYDFVDNNPMVEMHPVSYINDPRIIMQNDNLISINSCIQVDLTGQICSESIGSMQISGIGGQVDFVRGASMSRGGKAIIAMPSTAAGGKVSRIRPVLDEGAIVTTSRCDAEYVVTEYGVALLRGKTTRERSRALIAIAHPDFREELMKFHKEKFGE